jgi:ketosteroid isomerase-like protein
MMGDEKAQREANKALIRRYFETVARDGFGRALELVADNARWWIPGAEAELRKQDMIAAMDRAADSLVGNMGSEILTLTAEDDRVAAEVRGSALRKSGVRYDNIYHFLFRVRDGKIAEIREHHDTLYASQVFSDGLGGGAPTSR